MSVQFGDGVATSALIMLADLILTRVKVRMRNETRADALAIIKGVKPPPPRHKPLTRAFRRMSDPCIKCGNPVFFGEPCRVCFDGTVNQHIECKKTKALYDDCIAYVDEITLGV